VFIILTIIILKLKIRREENLLILKFHGWYLSTSIGIEENNIPLLINYIATINLICVLIMPFTRHVNYKRHLPGSPATEKNCCFPCGKRFSFFKLMSAGVNKQKTDDVRASEVLNIRIWKADSILYWEKSDIQP